MDDRGGAPGRVACYRFGPFEADLERSELRKFEHRIRLERKPWQVLLVLAGHPGKVVSRAELQSILWDKNVFVDFESGLNVAIRKLRNALGDSAESPVYIETVAGEGYRFTMNVETVTAAGGPAYCPVPDHKPPAPVPSVGKLSGGAHGAWFAGRRVLLTVAMLALAVGLSTRKIETSAPPHPVTVLIGRFQNTTGEPVLDGTLRFALERELSNSGSVRVVSPERLQDILKLMRRSPGSELDRPLALEICRRTPALRALILGQVQKLGTQYLLTAEIIDPTDGTTIRAAETQAAQQQEILGAVRDLATQLHSDLMEGVTPSGVAFPVLEQVTTPSLEALQLYSEAADLMLNNGSDVEGSMELLRQALQLDPDFAAAHIMLAWQLFNSGMPTSEHFERALALSSTASERERLFIEGSYYEVKSTSPRDPAALKATFSYEELLRRYPDDFWAMNNLAGLYWRAQRFHEARMLQVRRAEIRPESTEQNLANLWSSFMTVGEMEAADRLVGLCSGRQELAGCAELMVVREFTPVFHKIRVGEVEDALKLAENLRVQYAGADDVKQNILQSSLSDVYMDLGRLDEELDLTRSSLSLESRVQGPAIVAYFRGDPLVEASASAELVRHPELMGPANVMRLAALGRFREAGLAIEQCRNLWPTPMVHLARGYLELEKGDLAASLRDLREGDAFYKEQHYDAVSKTSDRLASALERAGKTEEAIQVLSKAEDQLSDQGERAFVDAWNLVSRAHLARLYRDSGRVAEAATIETGLRSQLKLSDPDHIVLQLLSPTHSYRAALH